LIKDINTVGNSDADPVTSFSSFTPTLLPDGRLVFGANDGMSGHEPWVTDGTSAGTALVDDLNPGLGAGFYRISN
jgi:ELWxxDGT repeat protein